MKSPKFLACIEVSESLTYVLNVTVVNQLHEKQDVCEELALSMLHDLLGTLVCAVQFAFTCLTINQRSGLAGQCKTLVQVWQVVRDHKHGVAQLKELAQLFELFG
jgi:hypothetical protein